MSTTPAWLPIEYSTGFFYLDGHPSRYQPRPTGLNFGEHTGTGVFPLVIAVLQRSKKQNESTWALFTKLTTTFSTWGIILY